MDNQMSGHMEKEGIYTSEGGGCQVFNDRAQTQDEIYELVSKVFGNKQKIDFDEFSIINKQVSSEMFLSVLILFQTQLPCSENFNRYKSSYYHRLLDDIEDDAEKEVNMVASPKLMSKLSPIS